jgi:hypothetical protein
MAAFADADPSIATRITPLFTSSSVIHAPALLHPNVAARQERVIGAEADTSFGFATVTARCAHHDDLGAVTADLVVAMVVGPRA